MNNINNIIANPYIPKEEFIQRTNKIIEIMGGKNLDLCLIFGDEYRREYVRYISNYWPIFEKSVVFIFNNYEPVLGVNPEGENYAKESSVWSNIRNIDGLSCATVPEQIDFPWAKIYKFREVIDEFIDKIKFKRIGIVGLDVITIPLLDILKESIKGFEIVNVTEDFNKLRLIKSNNEIACIEKAFEIADLAYLEIIKNSKPGVSELEIAAAGEYMARKNGAEFIPFCNVSSGERTNTVIGRATEKKVTKGEIISAAIAIQYNGYISSLQIPFTVGGLFNEKQKKLVNSLVEAEKRGLEYLKNNIIAGEFVKAVRNYFRDRGLFEYDIYPPLHGIGTAEAESPYPNETSNYVFKSGMTVNTDISLFNFNSISNRIEEGFIITNDGYKPLSKLARKIIESNFKQF